MERQIDVLARTIWGEARSEPFEGKLAVAWTIKNRMHDKRWPDTWVDVASQAKQFSCWNDRDPNRPKLLAVTMEDQAFCESYRAALEVMFGTTADVTEGSNHYHTVAMNLPNWASADKATRTISSHVFYKL